MTTYRNQKGFTLIEVLVVISIVSILLVVLIPQVDQSFQRSKINAVRSDFRTFQLPIESYLRETNGRDMRESKLNWYIDHAMSFEATTSKKKDPWGTPYRLTMKNQSIMVQSAGLDLVFDSLDDYWLVLYHESGVGDICTVGFPTNNIDLSDIELTPGSTCGDEYK